MSYTEIEKISVESQTYKRLTGLVNDGFSPKEQKDNLVHTTQEVRGVMIICLFSVILQCKGYLLFFIARKTISRRDSMRSNI